MDKAKQDRLKKAGWKVGDAQDFLQLSDEEAVLIDMKLALAQALRERRERQGLTQVALAKRLGSSQSRVAKIEAADPKVSVDLLMRALLALGVTRQELGRVIGRKNPAPAA